jgi:L-rhamnose-H+ transport protein
MPPPLSKSGLKGISQNVASFNKQSRNANQVQRIFKMMQGTFVLALTELQMEDIKLSRLNSEIMTSTGTALLMPLAGSSGAATLALGAGILNGSFATPTRFMTRWKWENVWALWALFAMLILPWTVAFLTVPHLLASYQATGVRHALLLVIAFGGGYGIAAICFGLGVEAIGIALNFAIALGTATVVGSAIPLFWFHSESVFTRQGFVIEAGIAIITLGIVLCGVAGQSKERDQAKQVNESQRPPFAKGLAFALIAGAGSAFQNLGLAFGVPLLHRAAELGTPQSLQANVIWAPLLTATFVPYLLFCARLWKKNRSWSLFFAPQTANYWFFGFLMGALWFSSIVGYGAAASRMADLGPVLGWPLFMSAIILTSNVWGFALGEWKGAPRSSLITMFTGLVFLIVGFCTLAWSSRLA